MTKNCYKTLLLCAWAITLFSCAEDDSEQDNYVPVAIATGVDAVDVMQNNSIDIDVLLNDENIPSRGTLSVSNALHGNAEVIDPNGTSNDPSDDLIRYTPDADYTGADSFTYTICNNASPVNCETEDVSVNVFPRSLVFYNPDEIPYATLSEYNFFEGDLKNLEPVSGVLPYDLNSPLFSDYAHKKRFVWMPDNAKATYVEDFSTVEFPLGAMLIKNFFYDNVLPSGDTRIIETRVMFKTAEGWDFAEYVWNDEQTEATYTTAGSFTTIDWIEDGDQRTVNYRIPSRGECFTCHNSFGTPTPIGPKPQNLNKNYNYADGIENQLSKWIQVGYLENNLPSNIVSTVDWEDESLPLNLRVRSYLDINCAHCHSEESHCEYRPIRMAFKDNILDENIGICVTPDTQISPNTHIVAKGDVGRSVLHFRLSSVEEQFRMPLLGRTLQHAEGVRLIEDWINSLDGDCE